jgi:hypothetical protein
LILLDSERYLQGNIAVTSIAFAILATMASGGAAANQILYLLGTDV